MSALDPRTPVDDLNRLAAELKEIGRRIDLLEAPSGTQSAQAVKQLTALVANIQAQLDSWVAGRWTNAQVQTAINNSIAAVLAGNVSIGGTLYVGGKVTAPGIYALNVVPGGRPRTAVWVDNIGEVGHT